jgi:hypothetical protein
MNWIDTFASIETDAQLGGSLRTFYKDGAATFTSLTLRGDEGVTYDLRFTLTGTDLFGNDINTESASQAVGIQQCEPGESFDTRIRECKCAVGFGLVVADNTCRTCEADEVVPTGGASCTKCPALSVPDNSTVGECKCIPGYFGGISGATGVCTQCQADTFRSAADSPVSCRPCPETSFTFSLGATSEAECLCSADTFNDRSGVNGTFSCAPVPEGGWAPPADSRLFALLGYWRPSAEYIEFFQCTAGMCLREEPPETTDVAQVGYRCREGHQGHLCAVCEEGWAYQGVFCSKCGAGHRYAEWSPAKRGGLIFIGLFLLIFVTVFLFFLPLLPFFESLVARAMEPAAERFENMLSNIAAAARPRSSDALARPQSAALRTVQPALGRKSETETAVVVHDGAAVSLTAGAPRASDPLARVSRAVRRSSHTIRMPPPDLSTHGEGGTAGPAAGAESEWVTAPQIRVQRPSRFRVLLDMIGGPLRIIVSFWQIVSSFSSNLYVPWPSVYYSLANSLNVVSLQFLKLPTISCVQPEVSFYTGARALTCIGHRHARTRSRSHARTR